MATVPTPYDATSGTKLTAADFDLGVRDPLLWSLTNFPRCRVWDNTGVSATSNAIMTWSAESYDNDSMHSTSSNTSRIVCNTAGLYQVSLTIQWPSNTYTVSDINARVNSGGGSGGGTGLRTQNYQTARVPKMDFKRFMNAGDYFEFFLNITPNPTTTVSGEFATYCEVHWLATA